MDFDKLLIDASGLPEGTSRRQHYMRIAEKLSLNSGQEVPWVRVKKWWERRSLPGEALAQVILIDGPRRPLNIAEYTQRS